MKWNSDQGNGTYSTAAASVQGTPRLTSANANFRPLSHGRASSLSQNWNNISAGNSPFNTVSTGTLNSVNGKIERSYGYSTSFTGGPQAASFFNNTSSAIHPSAPNHSSPSGLSPPAMSSLLSSDSNYRLPYSSPRDAKIQPSYNAYSTPIQRAYPER